MSMGNFANINSVLENLEKYCRIHSGTSNFYGVNEAQDFIAELLAKIDFEVTKVVNPGIRKSGDLLWGKKLTNTHAPTIICISHADTLDGVELDQNRYSLELTKTRIIGQGVLDDKASQFVCLWGLHKYFSQKDPPPLNIHFVSSPNEELGSYGFHNFFETLSLEANAILGFEPALDGKNIVSSRRGNRWYDFEIGGHEAHAGRSHKDGLNAAHELSHIISKLHKLTQYKKNITVNIGEMLTSSTTYNVVCGNAQAKLDTRFSRLKDRDDLHKKIIKIFEKTHIRSHSKDKSFSKKWSIVDDCPPLHPDRNTTKWLSKYAQIISKIENQNIFSGESGGGADICYFNRKGLIAIDGLGACGAGMHRPDEYVEIKSLESRANAFFEFLCCFARDFKAT